METTTETIDILNELIAINNDRIRGYENAIEETNEPLLKDLFENMIRESRDLRVDLAEEVKKTGGEFETGTTGAGKLYRAWMDIKAVFTGQDRHAILSTCEYGEDAAQRSYHDALSNEDLSPYLRSLLIKQQQILKLSHDKIKGLRDASANAEKKEI